MNTIKSAKTLVIFLLANIISVSLAQNSLDTAKLDSLLTYFSANNKMMGDIAIARSGKNLFVKAYGFSYINNDKKIPAEPNSRYRIGSISKMFTAVMIFQLIEEKKLGLDVPLSDFFPQLPNAKKITIQDLLSHRSGLHNFTSDSSYMDWYTRPKTENEMIHLFENQKPDFEPGAKAEYSNTNYVLLGYIIEKITKDSYANELKKRITDKIGLKNTYYGHKINTNDGEAFSYSFENGKWKQQPETDMSIPGGAGAVVSTPEDLNKFIQAIFRNKLTSGSSLKEMTTIKDNYGLGIFRFPFYDLIAYGHTGGIDGFTSMLAYFPHDSSSFALCFNGMNYKMNDILIGVLSVYYNKPYTFPSFKTFNIPESELVKYVGYYSSPALPLKIVIKSENGSLTAQATGQSAFPLTPVSETEFTFDPAGITIVFKKTQSGKYDEFTLKQGGGSFLYTREK